MSKSNKNWVENYRYLQGIYMDIIGELSDMPRTREDFEAYFKYIDEDIPMNELKTLLRRVHEFQSNDLILKNNIKNQLAEELKILGKREFDKIWKEFENKISSKESKKQELMQKTKKESLEKESHEIPKKYKLTVNTFLESEEKFKFIKETLDFKIIEENNNKVLIFVLLSGVYSNYYQIILITGESSGGKSHLANSVLELFPDNHKYETTGISDKAIIYKEWKDELIIYLSEARGNSEIMENLKDFGDKGIIYSTVERGKDKRFKTRDIVIGKKSIIATSTAERLNTELENRAWKIEPDFSKDQSEKIISYTIKRIENRRDERKKEKDFDKKKRIVKYSIQTLAKEYNFDKIEIPYASILEPIFNYNLMKVRRDHAKFIQLIMIITSWNYKIRDFYEENNEKVLLSHPNDLKVAFEIGEEIFMNLSQNLSVEKMKILRCMENLLGENTNSTQSNTGSIQAFTGERNEGKKVKTWYKTDEIYKHFRNEEKYNKSKKSFRNLLNVLSEDAYLLKKKEGNSNEYKLEESAIIKTMNFSEIREECLQLYKERKRELKDKKKVKFDEVLKENEFEDAENLGNYSSEIYNRILELFQAHDYQPLYEENIIQIASLDYTKKEILHDLDVLIKLGKFERNSEKELIYNGPQSRKIL